MNITIYSTTICGPCHSLTGWLDKIGQPYTKKLIDADPLIMREFIGVNEGMIGVPFTVVTDDNGTVTKINGFDQKRFKQVLDI
jgi:glutaredoxin